MWLTLAFLSALLLGVYDTCKKAALNGNAVIPVLLLNTLFSSLLLLPIILLSVFMPDVMSDTIFYVPPADLRTHIYIFVKSCIVLSSWLFAYFATKHLPITIAAPIKASQPILTLLGALLFFGEALNGYQWMGVIIAIVAFIMLSISGRKEGINFKHNVWILFIVMATVTGAISGLYDKYLMSNGFHRMTVLVWYSFYQLLLMSIITMVLWYPKRKATTPFVWRKSIFFISLFLIAADFVYFYALSYPASMISIVSMVRRSSVVVSFTAGAILFREKNIRSKAIDLLLVLIGMIFLYLGTR
ncbi:MAG: EamA family transporter [Bacteroidaceae bacterium]|nr:EamA family transporter [Bacteroidaceae bacterium]